MYQFSLNLSSLQQKFSLMSNYLGTNTVVVKSVDCIYIKSDAMFKRIDELKHEIPVLLTKAEAKVEISLHIQQIMTNFSDLFSVYPFKLEIINNIYPFKLYLIGILQVSRFEFLKFRISRKF